jgi:hypothetical protein
MNSSIRLFSIVAFAITIAACSEAADSIGDVSTASPTAVPAVALASPDPTPSLAQTASPATTVPSHSPIPSPVATPSPTEPAIDPATVLAADGIGPYVVGARLSVLESQGLVANVEPSFHCYDEWQNAEATGRYAGHLHLSFYLGQLIDVHTASPELVTPSGAIVGMPLAELQRIYGTRGTVITGVSGNEAFSVHVPAELGIVFFLDETNTKVWSMSAGEVKWLDSAAVVGEGC